MALAGNLRTMDLSEILQWVSTGRKTGALHIERRSIQKRIYFEHGVICSSWSNDPRESLGQIFVRERLLTEEQLFGALNRAEKEKRPFGVILVDDGVITEDQIRNALRVKAEETIYDLFLWPEGKFEFKAGETPGEGMIVTELDVTSALLEGARRVDEWTRIHKAFPNLSTSFEVKSSRGDKIEPIEAEFLALALKGSTLPAIALEMRRSDFDAAEIALQLHNRGLLDPQRTDEEAVVEDSVAVIKDLLAMGSQRLAERRYDKALEAYEQVLGIDRLNQHAKKGLVAVMETRSRERSMKKVPLDKVPRLTISMAELTRLNFDPQEGFVLSRVNGQWDVQSILKLCPMSEEDCLLIFSRLLERKVIELA
jgi:hypothetical protein